MSDDLEDLLRDHYRRAAENIDPDAALLARVREATRAPRPKTWPLALAAAAAVALVTIAAWGLLRPSGHREQPVTPRLPVPPAVATTPSPSPPAPTPSPTRARRPQASSPPRLRTPPEIRPSRAYPVPTRRPSPP